MDPPPVFVGGTGRSGTTVTGRLVGALEGYVVIPIELRFHTDRGGLPDVLSYRVTHERFIERLQNEWFYRELPNGETRGLHKHVDRSDLDHAIDVFRDQIHEDRVAHSSCPWSHRSCSVREPDPLWR